MCYTGTVLRAYRFYTGIVLLVAMDRPSQGGVVGGVTCGISGSIGFVSVRSARLNGGWCAKGLMLQSEKLQLGF